MDKLNLLKDVPSWQGAVEGKTASKGTEWENVMYNVESKCVVGLEWRAFHSVLATNIPVECFAKCHKYV